MLEVAKNLTNPRLPTLLLLTLLMLGSLCVFTNLATANFSPSPPRPTPVYLRSDGSVDPPNASINRIGNVYTLTGNLTDFAIVVQRDNIILDGAGYTLQYQYSGDFGVSVENRTNVTVENLNVTGFWSGIYVENSSQITVMNNNISMCSFAGVHVFLSSNVNVVANRLVNNGYANIQILNSSANTITKNVLMVVQPGVVTFGFRLWSSSNNIITNNNLISSSMAGFDFGNSSNNLIYHNNLVNGILDEYVDPNVRASFPSLMPSVNLWDNDKEGNYWGKYNDTDTNNDGIYDRPYGLNEYNLDHYPLINPVIIEATTLDSTSSPSSAQKPIPTPPPTPAPSPSSNSPPTPPLTATFQPTASAEPTSTEHPKSSSNAFLFWVGVVTAAMAAGSLAILLTLKLKGKRP